MKIPRNSMDIISKHLVGALPQESLSVFGIHDVNIVRALPTELDAVDIRQEFTDVVFELSDGRIFHMEFQTTKENTLHRFLMYDAQLAAKFDRKIRTVVLYTREIRMAPDTLDIGTAQYQVENVFLSQFDGDAVLARLEQHLSEQHWTPEDRILLAFALYMQFKSIPKETAFDRVLDITRKIEDKHEQDYIVALLLGLHVKRLSEPQLERLKEVLKMTDIVRDIIKEVEEETMRKGIEQGIQQGQRKQAVQTAKRMLSKGFPDSEIEELTGLSKQEIDHIRRELTTN